MSSHTGMLWSSVLCSLGVSLGIKLVLSSNSSRAHQRFYSYRSWLAAELRFVRVEMSADTVLALQVALLLGGAIWSAFHLIPGLLALVVGLSVHLILKQARQKRTAALEQQIESWLNSLARALDAAPSLGEALETSIGACEAPMREEVEVLINELHLGRPLDRTLSQWAARVNSRTLTMALSTLQVGRETGGKLGEVLRSAASSLREMERLEGVIRTKTAEGKAQAMVISFMPFPLYFAVKASDPLYFVPLETSSTGTLLIATAVVLWIAAGFSARKILAVQI